MKQFKFKMVAALALAGLIGVGIAQQNGEVTLKVGDKAPAMTVSKWVKGTPATQFEPGKVYVVEFWATWCGPCIAVFPHLSELAKKYGDKVHISGINIADKPTQADYVERIEKFVKDQGDRMSYNVATDTSDSAMQKTWFRAAGQNGIPCAMIVDKEGKIAWIGHPSRMDEPLAAAVAK